MTGQDLDSDFTTRSGVFCAVSDKLSMRVDAFGQYEYAAEAPLVPEERAKIEQLDGMRHADEDEIGSRLYGNVDNIEYDPVIGFHSALYCGYVVEGDYRRNATSGGLASWVLTELLERDLVDGVVAVTKSNRDGVLYEYSVLRTPDEVRASAKSRYYPMELSAVLRLIATDPGRFAIIGIPSFISDVRRLQLLNPVYRERIPFTLALLCGHQKTMKYGEAIGFQAGFTPGEITDIDFRLKVEGGVANDYVTEVVGRQDGAERRVVCGPRQTYVNNWSAGMFKVNFSDFVDDCFGETADLSIGDAWLPQYVSDSRGTNVVIVRNPVLRELLDSAAREQRLHLDTVDVQTVKASQPGLIRHYRGELPYRLHKFSSVGILKRVAPSPKLPLLRRRVQALRVEIAKRSKIYYREAVARSDWSYFESTMAPILRRYRLLHRLAQLQDMGVTGVIRALHEKRRARKAAKKEAASTPGT